MPDNKMDMVFKTCVQLQNLIQPVLTNELNSCLPIRPFLSKGDMDKFYMNKKSYAILQSLK